jgi:hypothetical protein
VFPRWAFAVPLFFVLVNACDSRPPMKHGSDAAGATGDNDGTGQLPSDAPPEAAGGTGGGGGMGGTPSERWDARAPEGQCLNLLYHPPVYEPCCPDPAPPDCSDKPEGYPGFMCVPNCEAYPDAGYPCSIGGSYCTCKCSGGKWACFC